MSFFQHIILLIDFKALIIPKNQHCLFINDVVITNYASEVMNQGKIRKDVRVEK